MIFLRSLVWQDNPFIPGREGQGNTMPYEQLFSLRTLVEQGNTIQKGQVFNRKGKQVSILKRGGIKLFTAILVVLLVKIKAL